MIKRNNILAIFLSLSLMLMQVSVCQGQARVVGGNPTVIDYTPFLVQIFNKMAFHCAGTLISDRHVLTACHCVQNVRKEDFMVQAGATHLFEYGIRSQVDMILASKQFTPQTMDFDVAVLKLTTAMKGNLIRPIALSNKTVVAGEVASIYGWGERRNIADYTSTQLYTAAVIIVDPAICKEMYRNILPVTDHMVCAFAPGRSTCSGDSGGPMLVDQQLVGVVSFGINCGVGNNIPAVFAKVGAFSKFIKEALQK